MFTRFEAKILHNLQTIEFEADRRFDPDLAEFAQSYSIIGE